MCWRFESCFPRQTQTSATLPTARALGPGLNRSGGSKLYSRYEQHLFKLRREAAKEQIESEIRYFLRNETLSFGANDSVELEKIVFDWPDFWEQYRAPTFQVVVRSIDPKLPSYKQVQQIQDTINKRLSGHFPGLELQMQVLEDEPKDRAENLVEREVCSQTDC